MFSRHHRDNPPGKDKINQNDANKQGENVLSLLSF